MLKVGVCKYNKACCDVLGILRVTGQHKKKMHTTTS